MLKTAVRGIVEKILLDHQLMQRFIIESDTSKLCASVDLDKMDSINRTSPSLAFVDLQKEVYCLKLLLHLRTLFAFFGRVFVPISPSVLRWKASPFLFFKKKTHRKKGDWLPQVL